MTFPTPPPKAWPHLIKGTMALPHPYGRLQFGEDLDLTFRTLAGIGTQPERRRRHRHLHRAQWTNLHRQRDCQDRQAGGRASPSNARAI
jgi:hypothetical protein